MTARTPIPLTADRLAELMPAGATTLVSGCSCASDLLADLVEQAGEALGATTFTGIAVPGLNRRTLLADGAATRRETFFMTPELAALPDRVTLLPLNYAQIAARYRAALPTAVLFSATPPDAEGRCHLGPTVDFLPDLWTRIPVRIAHLNPLLPRCGPSVPYDALTAAVEMPERPPGIADAAPDPVTATIAAHVAGWVRDGATLQTGLGKLPGAILRALRDRRRLRIHSGLIGDAVLDLLDAGAIARGEDVTAGVAIGSERLYAALPDSGIAFRPVSHTHDPAVVAALPDLVTLNGALAIDLYGQAYAEVARSRWLSGSGGATDFARAALAGAGLRIVALPSSAGSASRIVAPGAGDGPVSLSRTDIDIVATEHGAADLRGVDANARAAALIAIAAPNHREDLARAWRDGPGRY